MPWPRFPHRLVARPSLCALDALRRSVSGANIPTPVGRAHFREQGNCYVLGASASIMGSELPRCRAPALRFAAVLCLENIVGQIRVRIKATAPCLFGGDDEVISVGITIGALQDDMK
jgi:hypothetical protein